MNIKLAFVTLSIIAALSTSVVQAQQQSVYATGLEGPRGLKFGPDGALYVAEAGLGGNTGGLFASRAGGWPVPWRSHRAHL